jgi:hypothetical protein
MVGLVTAVMSLFCRIVAKVIVFVGILKRKISETRCTTTSHTGLHCTYDTLPNDEHALRVSGRALINSLMMLVAM